MKGFWKKIVSVSVAAGLVVTALSGCQGKGGADGTAGTDTASGEKAMGRYLEEEIPTPEGIREILDMVKMQDGKLRILGCDEAEAYTLWDSGDGGASWEKAGELPADLFGGDGIWISDAALSPSGDGFLCGYGQDVTMYYYHMTAEAQVEEVHPDLGEISFEEDGEDGNGFQAEEMRAAEVKAEGETGEPQTEAESMTEEKQPEAPENETGEGDDELFFNTYEMDRSNELMGIGYSPDGVLFASDYNGKLYQINPETGELEKEIASGVSAFAVAGNVVLVEDTSAALVLYDAGTGETLEQDQTLSDIMKDEGGMTSYVAGGKKFLFQSGDEENSLYYCDSQGLYRHVLGGAVNEQLIDGNLNSLSSPDTGLIAMSVLDDGAFLILASTSDGNSRILKYTYSKDTPSRPSKELKLYALNDSAEIRQAISMFQKEHADYYINFEVGLSGEDGVTVSDALKTLNTDIMAGKGPDIMVLDGMPIQSYIEKGLLVDLTDIFNGLKEGDGCFENIAGTFQTENGICAIPSRFSVPVIAGKQEILDAAEDLDTFVDEIEKLRAQDGQTAGILDSRSPEVLTEKLYQSYSPALVNADGSLNQEKVKEFYAGVKRIYDTGNFTEEEQENVSYNFATMGGGGDSVWSNISIGVMDILGGSIKANIGTLTDIEGFNQLLAGDEKMEMEYGLLNLAGKKVYCPETILGISGRSTQVEEAGEFVSYLLGKETQMINQGGGFPVNRSAYAESTVDNSNGEMVTGFVSSDTSTGETISLDVHWASQEELDALLEKIDSLDTPGLTDHVIGDAVKEQAVKYLKDECTAEEAVSNLVQKVNLYLAE